MIENVLGFYQMIGKAFSILRKVLVTTGNPEILQYEIFDRNALCLKIHVIPGKSYCQRIASCLCNHSRKHD